MGIVACPMGLVAPRLVGSFPIRHLGHMANRGVTLGSHHKSPTNPEQVQRSQSIQLREQNQGGMVSGAWGVKEEQGLQNREQ